MVKLTFIFNIKGAAEPDDFEEDNDLEGIF